MASHMLPPLPQLMTFLSLANALTKASPASAIILNVSSEEIKSISVRCASRKFALIISMEAICNKLVLRKYSSVPAYEKTELLSAESAERKALSLLRFLKDCLNALFGGRYFSFIKSIKHIVNFVVVQLHQRVTVNGTLDADGHRKV